MKNIFFLMIATTLLLAGCRTLDPSASVVKVIDRAEDNCENLGVVNVDWSFWGTSTESLNGMRNQVYEKGGNTLVVTGDDTGFAYSCPRGY